MNRWFVGGVLITAVIGILFITSDTYPAIRTHSLEESIGIIDNGITENKTKEMLLELTSKEEGGVTGNLTDDLNRALWFSSSKETIRAKGEVFQDVIGYSEIKDLKTEIRKVKEAQALVVPANVMILSRPVKKEIKKDTTELGLEKNSITEKRANEPLFSKLSGPEKEEVSVPIDQDSAIPYTSILLVSMIIGSLVSFMLTCTWCTWAIPVPSLAHDKRGEEKEEMPLAA